MITWPDFLRRGGQQHKLNGSCRVQYARSPPLPSMVQPVTSLSRGSHAPTIKSWQRLWNLWDAATLDMIPAGRHLEKPLELRHPFIFYLGHVPAFTDARLARVLQQQLTEPAAYATMFARGIDPDLNDPSQCHSHSPVPEQWPPVIEVLQYRDRVRQRVLQLYQLQSNKQKWKWHSSSSSPAANSAHIESFQDEQLTQVARALTRTGGDLAALAAMPAELQHVLWLSFEHEAMHLETFTYMLLQYRDVLPPPQHLVLQPQQLKQQQDLTPRGASAGLAGCTLPGACGSLRHAEPLVLAPAQLVPVLGGWVCDGVDRSPLTAGLPTVNGRIQQNSRQYSTHSNISSSGFSGMGAGRHSGGSWGGKDGQGEAGAAAAGHLCFFGWDNEMPARRAWVAGFSVQHRPVTVLEYCRFLAEQLASQLRHNAMASVPRQHLIPLEPEKYQDEGSSSGSADAAGSDTLRCADVTGIVQQLQQLLQADRDGHSLMPLSLQVDFDSMTARILSSSDATTSASVCSKTAAPWQNTPALAPDDSGVVFSVLQQLLKVKSVFGPVPLAEAGLWPVYCSALQAGQYAEWFSRSAQGLGRHWRLMTENEWLLARQHNMGRGGAGGDAAPGSAVDWPAMAAASSSASDIGVNFNTWHPTSVALLPSVVHASSSSVRGSAGGDQLLVSQLTTNGWEWTNTAFGAHPGFQADVMYPEYSTDFFDGRHLVLRGASWATLDCIASRGSFRNWYQAGQTHVFGKFRLCCDDA